MVEARNGFTPVIPALGRLRWKGQKTQGKLGIQMEVRLDNVERPWSKSETRAEEGRVAKINRDDICDPNQSKQDKNQHNQA